MQSVYDKPDCAICERVKDLANVNVQCDKCITPLHPDNESAARVLWMCHRQYIMSFGGIVDIDLLGVECAMRNLNIDGPGIFERVVAACRAGIQVITEKAERERASKR